MTPKDGQLQDLLAAVTDALLADESTDLDTIVAQYHVPHEDVAGLVTIVRRLHVMLVGAQPSRRFVRRLKSDLMGAPQRGMVSRIRHLPPRVQIAAGVALIAGFMLLTRRRMLDDARHEAQDIPLLQQ
jgi:type VI protein secretion system component VasF